MSNDHDDGGPAWPNYGQDDTWHPGMTLLDYFAGQAMLSYVDTTTSGHAVDEQARWSYDKAAAMLAEKRRREKGQSE